MPNYYEILGVEPNAELAQIKKVYRKKSLKIHPDRNPAPNAQAQIQELNEAYEVLQDSQQRKKYDVALKSIEAAYPLMKSTLLGIYLGQPKDDLLAILDLLHDYSDEKIIFYQKKLLTSKLTGSIDYFYKDSEQANRMSSQLDDMIQQLNALTRNPQRHTNAAPALLAILLESKRYLEEKVLELAKEEQAAKEHPSARTSTKRNYQYFEEGKPVTLASLTDLRKLKDVFLNECDDDLSKRKALFIVGNGEDFSKKIVELYTKSGEKPPTFDEALNKLRYHLGVALEQSTQRDNRLSYLAKLHTALAVMLRPIDQAAPDLVKLSKMMEQVSMAAVKAAPVNRVSMPDNNQQLTQLFLGEGKAVNPADIKLKAEFIFQNFEKLAEKICELETFSGRRTPSLDVALGHLKNDFVREGRCILNADQHLLALQQELDSLMLKQSMSMQSSSNIRLFQSARPGLDSVLILEKLIMRITEVNTKNRQFDASKPK